MYFGNFILKEGFIICGMHNRLTSSCIQRKNDSYKKCSVPHKNLLLVIRVMITHNLHGHIMEVGIKTCIVHACRQVIIINTIHPD